MIRLAVLLAFILACAATEPLHPPDVPDTPPPTEDTADAVLPTIPPECDPGREPDGCTPPARCWHHRCVTIDPLDLGISAHGSVGAMALAPLGDEGAVLAFHAHPASDEGPNTSPHSIWTLRLEESESQPAALLHEWHEERSDGGPLLAVAPLSDSHHAVLLGPDPLEVFFPPDRSSAGFATGARIIAGDGRFRASAGATGEVFAIYHDVPGVALQIVSYQQEMGWRVAHSATVPPAGLVSRFATTRTAGGLLFVHVDESDRSGIVRGARLFHEGPQGWTERSVRLADGLAIRGRVLGIGATTDSRGEPVIGWLTSASRLGLARKASEDRWDTDDGALSEAVVSEELRDAFALAAWGEVIVAAWIAEPDECVCSELRLAMWYRGRFQERGIERYERRAAGSVALAITPAGWLYLAVGGEPGASTGLPAPALFVAELPIFDS